MKQSDAQNKATRVLYDPEAQKGTLKSIGGSQSDDWNDILANQTVQSLSLKRSDPATRYEQYSATVAALAGIGPKDELEGMMAAQLIAAHNAAMECYRRAMIAEQTFEGRRDFPGGEYESVLHLKPEYMNPRSKWYTGKHYAKS
jgi:hypothetical protein